MQVKTYLISEGVKYTETIIEDGYINKIYKVDNCRKDIYAIPDACIDIQFIYERADMFHMRAEHILRSALRI